MAIREVLARSQTALERALGVFWVGGEVDDLKRPSSGHVYFTLVDGSASLPCVLWRSDARRLGFALERGLEIHARGKAGIYERGGRFQMYVSFAEPAGRGAEARALEALKNKLAAEGLFDVDRKRPLPGIPRRIGVVTSATGAAVRDIIRAVNRRFPTPILVADARVQGAGAADELRSAIEALGRADVDVVIIGRGGGSSGDLASFNEESVVRAIAACPHPTVSAVGHEIDVSLADLVADHRAATPTMAGEMVVPVRDELRELLLREAARLPRAIKSVTWQRRQEVDVCAQRAHSQMLRTVAGARRELRRLEPKLAQAHPRTRWSAARRDLEKVELRLHELIQSEIAQRERALATASAQLDALSPLRVLGRGYALARKGNQVLTAANQAQVGERVEVTLRHGALGCCVEEVRLERGDSD